MVLPDVARRDGRRISQNQRTKLFTPGLKLACNFDGRQSPSTHSADHQRAARPSGEDFLSICAGHILEAASCRLAAVHAIREDGIDGLLWTQRIRQETADWHYANQAVNKIKWRL